MDPPPAGDSGSGSAQAATTGGAAPMSWATMAAIVTQAPPAAASGHAPASSSSSSSSAGGGGGEGGAAAAVAVAPRPTLREGETHWSLFTKGLHFALHLWTVVDLAIAHGFGGKNTPHKDMFSSRRKKVADLDELEDFLYDYLSEQLRVEAEDGSVEEVSDIILDLYEAIYKDDDISSFEKLESQWHTKLAKSGGYRRDSAPAPVPAPTIPASASSAAGTTTTPTQEVEMGEAEPQAADPDGWEVVSHKKKRGGK